MTSFILLLKQHLTPSIIFMKDHLRRQVSSYRNVKFALELFSINIKKTQAALQELCEQNF